MSKEQKVKIYDTNESFFSSKIVTSLDKIMSKIDSEKGRAILVDEGTSEELRLALRDFRKAAKKLCITMIDKVTRSNFSHHVTLGPKTSHDTNELSHDTNEFFAKLVTSLEAIVRAIDSETSEAITIPSDNSEITEFYFASRDFTTATSKLIITLLKNHSTTNIERPRTHLCSINIRFLSVISSIIVKSMETLVNAIDSEIRISTSTEEEIPKEIQATLRDFYEAGEELHRTTLKIRDDKEATDG